MSDLALGPIIGTIGGGAEIVDIFEGTQTNTLDFDLPEGSWVVLIYAGRAGILNPTITFDDTQVLPTQNSMTRGTAAVRGVTGGSHKVSKTGSGDSTIYRVSYFPDPIGDDSH